MGVHAIKYIIGIDEVGRGALAGPVVVAAALIENRKWKIENRRENGNLGMLKDSKQLSAKQREAWLQYFENCPAVSFAIARVYPRQIEQRNISGAANLAALRAYKKLVRKYNLSAKNHKVLLDGSLFLGGKSARSKFADVAVTIVKGDEKFKAIAAASIIAKVHRDRFMTKLAKKYVNYGLEIHKGYGTKFHRAAIETHGPSIIHRLTFLKKSSRMS